MRDPANLLPTYDPNWFYSSLAQSAASIVGVIGAILGPHLQSQIEKASEQRVRAIEALRQLDQEIQPVFRQYSLYVRESASQMERLRNAIRNGSELKGQHWHSPFDCGQDNVDVGVSEHYLTIETARAQVAQAVLPLLQQVINAKDAALLAEFARLRKLLPPPGENDPV